MDVFEFCKEPDLAETLKWVLKQATDDGVDLQIFVFHKPKHEKGGGLMTLNIDPKKADVKSVLGVVEKRLGAALDEEAEGILRLYFRPRGDTSVNYTTFQRTLKSTGEESASGESEGARVLRQLERMVYQTQGKLVEMAGANAQQQSATAEVIRALNPDMDTSTPWGAIGAFAGGVLQSKLSGRGAPQGQQPSPQQVQQLQAMQVYAQQMAHFQQLQAHGMLPPGMVPMPPPLPFGQPMPGTNGAPAPQQLPGQVPGRPPQPGQAPGGSSQPPQAITSEGLMAWAEQHPDEAQRMILDLGKKWGFDDPNQIAAVMKLHAHQAGEEGGQDV